LDEKYKNEKKELNDYCMELENKVAVLASEVERRFIQS